MPRAAKAALFVLAGAAAAIACAADLEGKPEDYIAAYNGPPGGSGGPGVGGTPNSSGGDTGTAGTPATNGGASGGSGTVTIPPDPPCVKTVFEKTANGCSTICHTKSAPLGGLDLTGSDLGKRLSMTEAQYQVAGDASACDQGAHIIEPGNPSRSVLLRKVKAMQSCGDEMPIGTGLSGSDLECIENWVNSFGASANVTTLDEGSGVGGNSP